MSIDVIMPVLGMAQETGKIVRWLKSRGEQVKKGEPLIEVETDKAIAEIEAPGDGVLLDITAHEGDEVPVATVIAKILAPEEMVHFSRSEPQQGVVDPAVAPISRKDDSTSAREKIQASPVARRIAQERGVDLRLVQPDGGRIEKADVLAYINNSRQSAHTPAGGRLLASPKARRLMRENAIDPADVAGSGPGGAVLAADVATLLEAPQPFSTSVATIPAEVPDPQEQVLHAATVGSTWRIMAERTTQSWQSAPHFYLMREVNAGQFVAWRENLRSENLGRVTYTDLLVKIVAEGLLRHPRMNARWKDGEIELFSEINIGLAVASEDGLVVPVIHRADHKGVLEIAAERERLVERAKSGRLHLDDISRGTFTLSNLGMYGVDVFNAVVNPPQAAILAVGRIAERVVPLRDQPAVQSMMMISLSCDHRAVDGALGAFFLQSIAEMIEQPLRILS